MAGTQSDRTSHTEEGGGLKRAISGRLLFFYVLGDVLGSGIYVLIGPVAAEVGGALRTAFALGVSIAIITGLAYAELITKYPQAAGAALFVSRAFKNNFFTFVVTFCMLSASFAAAGTLALAFGGEYFQEFFDLPTLLVASLVIIVIGVTVVVTGDANYGAVTEFRGDGNAPC